jgi:hypothetical protein
MYLHDSILGTMQNLQPLALLPKLPPLVLLPSKVVLPQNIDSQIHQIPTYKFLFMHDK